jgi:hypothetical protein
MSMNTFAKEQPLCHARQTSECETRSVRLSMVSLSERCNNGNSGDAENERAASRQLCDLASKNHPECLKTGTDRGLESTPQRRSGVESNRNVWSRAAGVQRSRSRESDQFNFARIAR